jgi:hypothetical protein
MNTGDISFGVGKLLEDNAWNVPREIRGMNSV